MGENQEENERKRTNKITGDCNVKLEKGDTGGKFKGLTQKLKNACSSVTSNQKKLVNVFKNIIFLVTVWQCKKKGDMYVKTIENKMTIIKLEK